jgi:purine-binding chemotaxis protein CheW
MSAMPSTAGASAMLLFRLGRELFAVPLAAALEAVERPPVDALPEMPAAMLGVATVRGEMLPVYSPEHALGTRGEQADGVLLVLRDVCRRVAIAIDDVEDVIDVDTGALHPPPLADAGDAVLIGLARHGRELVSILDADALVRACVHAEARA